MLRSIQAGFAVVGAALLALAAAPSVSNASECLVDDFGGNWISDTDVILFSPNIVLLNALVVEYGTANNGFGGAAAGIASRDAISFTFGGKRHTYVPLVANWAGLTHPGSCAGELFYWAW